MVGTHNILVTIITTFIMRGGVLFGVGLRSPDLLGGEGGGQVSSEALCWGWRQSPKAKTSSGPAKHHPPNRFLLDSWSPPPTAPWREVSPLKEARRMGWAEGTPSLTERTGNCSPECHLFRPHFPATWFPCGLVSFFLLSIQWAVVGFSLQEPPLLLLEFQRKICSQAKATLSPQTTYVN